MRTKKGIVTSAKMQDTVTVTVHRSVVHALYQKRFRVSTKFLADSKGQDLGVGDEVVITECRPLSKRKYFRVTEVLKRAPRVSELVEESALDGVIQSKTSQEKSPTNPKSPKSPKSSEGSSDSSASSDSSVSSKQ